ncbi:hypothetical protein [Marixanthomonas spongiae]|uniref:Uncharacterized protein n=1 Tax=Marixanthomonas spongiae TaxID=2174845 RepID=A0A2U0HW32_9FLAO|nr:hypothetical protein [Marixanthomonas spongiae]PVW13072.1 hypothetical protein DDV96_14220 [Marixanthomonas spongiae]
MDELFNSVFHYIVLSFYGIATVTAILFYGKYKHTVLKYFVWILIYNLINEISAKYVYYWLDRNVIMYNVYNTVFFSYFFYVFWNFVKGKTYKKWIVYSVILFLIATVINVFTVNAYYDSLMISYITGACLIIFCIILYYIEILSDTRVLHIREDLLFWISIGLLLFYVGYIPIKLSREFFAGNDDLFITLYNVQRILIIIMYSCFTMGFIWTKKK